MQLNPYLILFRYVINVATSLHNSHLSGLHLFGIVTEL